MSGIKISACPFCKKEKVKLENKSKDGGYKRIDGKYVVGENRSFSVRCNCCHNCIWRQDGCFKLFEGEAKNRTYKKYELGVIVKNKYNKNGRCFCNDSLLLFSTNSLTGQMQIIFHLPCIYKRKCKKRRIIYESRKEKRKYR